MSKKKTKPDNRETLKSYFKNGNRPTQENFERLIDSVINKADDGISKDLDDGLILAPEGENSNRTVSFVEKIGQNHPSWSIDLVDGADGASSGLGFLQPDKEDAHKAKLFFNNNGRVGIHTNDPKTDLEVQGTIGIQSRIGTYKMGTVPANGRWQPILKKLDGCNAFEVIAQVGIPKTGKHALLHATAVSTFGQFKNRIRRTQSSFGWWWWDRLAIRWKGDQKNFRLEVKTRSDYGGNTQIKFHITRLWSPDMMAFYEEDNTK